MIIPEHSTAFAILHHIANAVNPLLGIAVVLGFIWLWVKRREGARFWHILIPAVVSIALLYLIKNVEGHNNVWKHFGLNFSTHSAVALALGLAVIMIWRKFWWLIGLVWIVYAWLMVLLRFHSWMDIGTTAIVIFPLSVLCYWVSYQIIGKANTRRDAPG